MSIPPSAPVLEVSLLGKRVVRVAAGGFHCGALSEQGNVYMWGENTAGQCGMTEKGTVTNITGWLWSTVFAYFCPSELLSHIFFSFSPTSILLSTIDFVAFY